MDHDIIIVGGGPAGLSLALSLRGSGLRTAVVERLGRGELAEPAFDGREIALTHQSISLLREIGAWERIPPDQIFPLRSAQVLNGRLGAPLTFVPTAAGTDCLGRLVSNHLIRQALFAAASEAEELTLLDTTAVEGASSRDGFASIVLGDGRELTARLLVAADSRFSAVRAHLGISAEVKPVGRTMVVGRVTHERDHRGIATEWFDYRQTLALLPLSPHQSSAVLTVSDAEAEQLRGLSDAEAGAELTRRSKGRWGAMTVLGSRYFYPLVTTFADRFAVPGAALVGDAAVGMHPVTAHGFNLGLAGAASLARQMRLALRRGSDWSGIGVLREYERQHRLACRPLYSGTNALVRLFTDDRAPARLARAATHAAGRRMPLLKGAVQRLVLRA